MVGVSENHIVVGMRASRIALVTASLVFFFSSSFEVQATTAIPNLLNTCQEIRSKNPNGIAKNKKVFGLKKFPKAKVNARLYSENFRLDSNENGIICDKLESFSYIAAVATNSVLKDGVRISIKVGCVLSNPRIDSGYVVGYSAIRYEYDCDVYARNTDQYYSSEFDLYPKIYVVFEDQVTFYESWNIGRAFFQTDDGYLSYDLRPTRGSYEYLSGSGWLGGTKAEIDSLYRRIKNGLQPALYVGLTLGEFSGCFTRAQSGWGNEVVVSNHRNCMSGEFIRYNDNYVREVPDWDIK